MTAGTAVLRTRMAGGVGGAGSIPVPTRLCLFDSRTLDEARNREDFRHPPIAIGESLAISNDRNTHQSMGVRPFLANQRLAHDAKSRRIIRGEDGLSNGVNRRGLSATKHGKLPT